MSSHSSSDSPRPSAQLRAHHGSRELPGVRPPMRLSWYLRRGSTIALGAPRSFVAAVRASRAPANPRDTAFELCEVGVLSSSRLLTTLSLIEAHKSD